MSALWFFAISLSAFAAMGIVALLMASGFSRRTIVGRAGSLEEDEPPTFGVAGLDRDFSIVRGLLRATRFDRIASQLAAVGFSQAIAVDLYVSARIGLAILLGWGGWVVVGIASAPERLVLTSAVLAAIGAGVGWALPRAVIDRLVRRNLQRLEDGVHDAIDFLLIASEAGLSLDASLRLAARSLTRSQPRLACELEATAEELRGLADRHAAILRLGERLESANAYTLMSALAQMLRYGTPPTPALRVVSNDVYQTRLLKIEEQASRIPALTIIPLVLFILPCMVLVALGLLRAG